MARHAADFIESLRRKAVSIHTITNYERDLRHFAEFLESAQVYDRVHGSRDCCATF